MAADFSPAPRPRQPRRAGAGPADRGPVLHPDPRRVRRRGDQDRAAGPGRSAARQAWLDTEIEHWTSGRTAADILAALEAAEVPASRISSIADIVADPHYAAREMIRTIALPGGRTLKVPGVVPRPLATPGDFTGGGPALGEHTDLVFRDLGYDVATIVSLRRRGIVG